LQRQNFHGYVRFMQSFLRFSLLSLVILVFPAAEAVAQQTRGGAARFIVTRADEYRASLATAVIDVNGRRVAEVERGKTVSGLLPPGPVTIAAHSNIDPGQTTVKFRAVPGRTYRFRVSARTEPYIAGALFGIAGLIIEGGGPFKIELAK